MVSLAALAVPAAVIGFFVLLRLTARPEHAPARLLVSGLILALLAYYVMWRFTATVLPLDTSGPSLWILFCFAVEAAILAETAIFVIMLARASDRGPAADAHEARVRAMPPERLPSVDVFIPTFNEGIDVVGRTIVGALGLDYPKFAVWVLDDGGRDWLRDFCARHGVRYVTRPDNSHAKAGNINHALAFAKADLIAVFDADFVPQRDFLWRTVGFFAEPEIGMVQTPQHFFNRDPLQTNLGVQQVWPEEQRMFFDTILPARDGWDTAFCCGSGAVIRRDVLAAAGGFPTGSVTEDVLLSLVMLRHGYVTRYLNEPLSLGLAAESLRAYFVQRERWCRGCLQTLFLREGPLGPGLTLMQRLMFLPLFYLFQPVRIAMFVIPIVFLWTGLQPLRFTDIDDLVVHQAPLFFAVWLGLRWRAPETYLPFLSHISSSIGAMRLAPTTLATLIKPFGAPFRVTPKGSAVGGHSVDWFLASMSVGLTAATAGGLLINVLPEWRVLTDDEFLPVAAFWSFYNLVTLFFVILAAFERPRFRAEERFPLHQHAECTVPELALQGAILDISARGLRIAFPGDPPLHQGQDVTLRLGNGGTLTGRVVWTRRGQAGIRFPAEQPAAQPLIAAAVAARPARAPEQSRRWDRRPIHEPATCIASDAEIGCVILDASLGGAFLELAAADPPPVGARLRLDFPRVGSVACEVMRRQPDGIGVRFVALSEAMHDALVRRLYTEQITNNVEGELQPAKIAGALIHAAFGA